MLDREVRDRTFFDNAPDVENLAAQLTTPLRDVTVVRDEEHNTHALRVDDRALGYSRVNTIGIEFVQSGEYRTLLASYASEGKGSLGKKVRMGQGVVGQCALEKQKIVIDGLPPDYIRISSGLGEGPPRSVLVLPLIFVTAGAAGFSHMRRQMRAQGSKV